MTSDNNSDDFTNNSDDNSDDFLDKIKHMNAEEMSILHVAYLSFSSKFIEYVREIDPVMFKRALDYAATASNPQTTEN